MVKNKYYSKFMDYLDSASYYAYMGGLCYSTMNMHDNDAAVLGFFVSVSASAYIIGKSVNSEDRLANENKILNNEISNLEKELKSFKKIKSKLDKESKSFRKKA